MSPNSTNNVKKNIVLTGSNGYVGSYLLQSNLSNLYNFIPLKRNSFQDLIDSNLNIWAVIHLAGFAHQNSSKWEDYENANIHYTNKILELSHKLDIEHLVFLSSIKVLGEGGDSAYNEFSSPNPVDYYGKSKKVAEDTVKTFCSTNNIAYTILRPPLLYGYLPKANIRSLVMWIHKKRPVPISTKSNQRSILSLGNLESILQVILSNEKSHNQTFLLQDPSPLSTEKISRLIGESLQIQTRFFRIPNSIGNWISRIFGIKSKWMRLSGSLYVDDSFTRKVLDWEPPIPTQESIQKMIESMFKN